ncbi:transposase [Mycoplasmopsis felis]|nr:transposase [Mycoplasmopsis felis]WAM01294.1 transposase [Mycoplasmopsis felis]
MLWVWQCDINGIPIFYKVFPGNTADVKTLIPFFNEFKLLFPDKKIIVVADRGMSSAENIKFLERNQIDFLISYRAKVASKKYKEYLLNETDYVILNDDYKYKERQMLIQHNKDDSKLYERKQVISISKLRAKVDAYNRNIEIKNFKKHQNADGYVNEKAMIGRESKILQTN